MWDDNRDHIGGAMQPKPTNNQYALITGATSGFGYEFSKLLALNGYNLILVGRSIEKLRDVAESLTENFPVKIILLVKDLLNPQAPREIYRAIRDLGIKIDILINDAGKSEYGKFLEYDIDRDIDIIQLNITSLVSLTKLFLKDMMERNSGRILQISSLLGRHPTPLMSVYTAAKAFVITFTHGLIDELKGSNVTVTAMMPGVTEADFFHKENHDCVVAYQHERSVPEEVAREGFNALMSGESKIVSGFKFQASHEVQRNDSRSLQDTGKPDENRIKADSDRFPHKVA